jgi:hypothetical protein
MVVPYANTNPENQPHVLMNRKGIDKRKYALSAFMSGKLAGNALVRQEFIGSLSDLTNNSLAGLPVQVKVFEGRTRSLAGEGRVQEIYRDTIFCPCLRGDEPPQKRIFDAMLAGCIPVVLEYDTSHEQGYPSHFAKGADSIRITYPFAKGSFYGLPGMGVDWSEIVVAINGTCGSKCMLPVLEDLILNHHDELQKKQEAMLKYTRLYSYGMEKNGLQYVDAVVALLVQARHYTNTRQHLQM